MKLTLKLFICGSSPSSGLAIANLRDILEQQKELECELSIIDVLDRPDLAEHHKILVTPTLLRESPAPSRLLTGDLSDFATVKKLLCT